MWRNIRVAVIIVYLFSLSGFKPEGPVLAKITTALDTLRRHYPQEKVYLQSDKKIYYAGENIWFKGYVVYNNHPSTLSGILYVDFINKRGNVLQRKMLPLFSGTAAGNFTIAKDVPEGIYRINAYTAWMKNFDPAFMFHKDIFIATDSSLNIPAIPLNDTDFAIQFLPEGGNLVLNLTSFIAFKAIDSNGLPVAIKGKLEDEAGQVLNTFESVHDGMGKFALTPREGKKYFAVVAARGLQRKIALPQAFSTGVVLHIINKQIADSNNRNITYYVQKNDSSDKFDKLYVVVQMQDKPVDIEEVDFSSQRSRAAVQAAGEIDAKNFPEGIAQITLFNAKNGTPLAERLVFISSNHQSLASLNTDELSFASRGKEKFSIVLHDTLAGNYSVAVTDADKVPYNEEDDNILSNLLMTSDIKGPVFHPGWYFRDQKPERLSALDLVMLTNGWRRYKWDKILDNQFPPLRYYLEKSIVVRGQAFTGDPQKKAYYKNGDLILFTKTPHDEDSLDNMINIETDSLGRFSLKNLFFHTAASVYIVNSGGDTHKKRRKKMNQEQNIVPRVSVLFKRNLADTMPMATTIHIPFNKAMLSLTKEQADRYVQQAKEDRLYTEKNLAHVVNLKGITVKGKRLTHTDSLIQQYASAAFAGISGRTYDLSTNDYNRTDYVDNALDYISHNISGPVVMGNTKTSPIIYWRLRNDLMQGLTSATYLENAPDFFLNEELLNNGPSGYDRAISRLQMVKVADITLVRVFPPGFMALAPGNAPHGAIAFYTRQGANEQEKGTALDLINLKGYSVEKEFYSPDYSKTTNPLPDKRTTLYWNPYLIPNKNDHSASFSFYNNDSCKKFRIVIEGMGKNGELIHLEKVVGKK